MEIFLIFVTVISIATAAVALAAARRAAVAERRRSDARVDALAAAAVDAPEETGGSTEQDPPYVRRPGLALETRHEMSARFQESPARHETLFETVRRPDEGPARFGLAVGAVALIAIIAVVSVLALRGGRSNVSAPAVHASQPQLLELLTLEHTQEMRALVITGTVRNPSAGAKLEELTAVISLLDRNGTLIATKDVPLDYRALGPGEEAPFTLSLPDRGSIERYRVSFRAGTAIVPHVDRRIDAGHPERAARGWGPAPDRLSRAERAAGPNVNNATRAIDRASGASAAGPNVNNTTRAVDRASGASDAGVGPRAIEYGVPHVSI